MNTIESLKLSNEVLQAEKERADRLAEKLKAVQAENCLLKEALRKMC